MKIFEQIMARRGQIPHEKISPADLTLRHISVYCTVPGSSFMIELRGHIEVKGKGKMVTFWLVEKKQTHPPSSADVVASIIGKYSRVCHWLRCTRFPEYMDPIFGAIIQLPLYGTVEKYP